MLMKKDSLGDRIKRYESVSKTYLTRRVPVIIRLDGRSFHTFTKGCEKPFDRKIINTMALTAEYLIRNIQGAKVAYVQSDEISLLLTDFDTLDTDAWFGYSVQKMCSISAAMASVAFTLAYGESIIVNGYEGVQYKTAHFDSRAFNVPKEEVANTLRWRYQDWLRNSIQMLAQSLYSQKELHGKKSPELHEMCFQKGKNWNDLDSRFKNGTLYVNDKTLGLREIVDFNLNNNDFNNQLFNQFLYEVE